MAEAGSERHRNTSGGAANVHVIDFKVKFIKQLSETTTHVTTDYPIELPLQHYLVFKYILNNRRELQKVNGELDKLKADTAIKIADNGDYVIEINKVSTYTEVEVIIQVVQECILKAAPHVNTCTIPVTDCENVLALLRGQGLFQRQLIHGEIITVRNASQLLAIAFDRHQEQSVERFIKAVMSSNWPNKDASTHARKIEIEAEWTETVISLGLEDSLKETYPNIDFKMKSVESSGTLLLTLTGEETELIKAEKFIDSFKHDVVKRKSKIHISDRKFLQNENCIMGVNDYLRNYHKVKCHLEVDGEHFFVTARNVQTADKALCFIRKFVVEKQIQVEKSSKLQGMVESDKWEGIRRNLIKKHVFQVWISVKSDIIHVTGIDKYVDDIVGFLSENCGDTDTCSVGKKGTIADKDTCNEYTIQYIVDPKEVYSYLSEVVIEMLTTRAEKIGVQLKNVENNNYQGFLIQGKHKDTDHMKNHLDKFVQHVKTEDQEFDDHGYFHTSPGHDFMVEVENKCQVLIEVTHKQSPYNSGSVKACDQKKCIREATKLPIGTVHAWHVKDGYTVEVLKTTPEASGAAVIVKYSQGGARTSDFKWKQYANFSMVNLPLPIWKDEQKSSGVLQSVLSHLFVDILARNDNSLAIPLDSIDTWPATYFTASTIRAYLKLCCHGDDDRKDAKSEKFALKFCTRSQDVMATCSDVCNVELGGESGKVAMVTSCPSVSGDRPLHRIAVSVTQGTLSSTKADVLVNTVAPSLDLGHGAVSSSLLSEAGSGLQHALDKCYPAGLERGELATTRGYNLDCQFVLHGVLYPFKGHQEKEMFYRESVHNFVTLCLQKAGKIGCGSIAFPAVGSGQLAYPVDIVAEEMFRSVSDFSRLHGQTTLKEVVFVIYYTDDEAFEEYSRQKAEFDRDNKTEHECMKAGEQGQSTCVVKLVGLPDHVQKATQYIEDRLNLQTKTLGIKDPASIASPSTTTGHATDEDDSMSDNSANDIHGVHNPRNGQFVPESDIAMKIPSRKTLTKDDKSHMAIASREDLFMKKYKLSGTEFALLNHFHGNLLKKYKSRGVLIEHNHDTLTIEACGSLVEVFSVEFGSAVSKLNNLLKDEIDIRRKVVKEAKKYADELSELNELCCICDVDSKQVLFYSDCWNSVQSAKHKMKVHLRLVKPTARGHRDFTSNEPSNVTSELNQSDGVKVINSSSDSEAEPGLPGNSRGAVPKKSGTSSATHNNIVTFMTNEEVFVKVYEGDITNVQVDCIVNAANEKLKHGGGVAKVIAKASGKELTKQCDKFIRTHGSLRTGEVHTTLAGNLQYKYVIHAVGPRWADYRPHTPGLVESCEADLMAAIFNSLKEAEQFHMTSIAIPAVSSAIYGVPWQICTVQYARAVLKFSRSKSLSSLLVQIHFVDIKPEIVDLITRTFQEMIPTGKLPQFYRERSFLKHTSGIAVTRKADGDSKGMDYSRKQVEQRASTIAVGHSRSETKPDKTTSAELYPYYSQTQPRGKTENWFTCHLSYYQMLYVYTEDILSLTDIDVIVCSDDVSGSGKGIVAKKLAEKGGKTFEKAKTNIYKRSPQVGDVVLCEGNGTGFKWVIHAILHNKSDMASEVDQRNKRQEVFAKIFTKVKVLAGSAKSVAISLLGTGTGKGKAEFSSEHFWKSFTEFSRANSDFRLAVHMVNNDREKTHISVHTIKSQIDNATSSRPLRKQTGHSRPLSSTTTTTKQNTQAPTSSRSSATVNSSAQVSRSKSNATSNAGYHGDSSRSSHRNSLRQVGRTPDSHASHGSLDDMVSQLKIGDGQVRSPEVPDSTSDSEVGGDNKSEDEDCVICMDTMDNPRTLKCGHRFCTDCIAQQFAVKKVCPTCGVACGIITGDQPDGRMDVTVSQHQHCAGYETVGCIQITYSFPDGYQGPQHPNPGTRYHGITRTAYLPDNYDGRLVCRMLEIAFHRKLVFTIGSSRTTGQQGVITWNDIHHKTNPVPSQTFGYPDPTYLDRVTDELSAKGVTEKDVTT